MPRIDGVPGAREKKGAKMKRKNEVSERMKRPCALGVRAAAVFAVSAALVAGLALAGCGAFQPEQPASQAPASDSEASAQKAPAAYTFTDDMGNEVTVENPQRVVACMGSFANAWELAGGTLVGASDDALSSETYALSSPDVRTVGDFASIDLESILALDPDFVIMTSAKNGRGGGETSQVDLKDALDASGVPVAYFEVTVFDDYVRMMRTFCEITGRDDLYRENAERIEQSISDIVEKASERKDAPTALLMTTFSRGTRVQASSSMTGDMLADLGARNLADENRSLLSDFSLESVIELDPDFIFVLPMGNDSESAMRNLEAATSQSPAWSTLSAVENGRYIVLDPKMFMYKPNEKWDESYRVLAEYLYGKDAVS